MIKEILKTQYFYVATLSTLGLLLLLKYNFKRSIFLFTALFFCFFWRGFSYIQSSRYYSIFIFFGLLLSAFAVNYFSHLSKRKHIHRTVVFFFVLTLMLIHTDKIFSSFRNVYIFDLQESVKSIMTNEPESDIYIYDKEFKRIRNNNNLSSKHLKIIFPEIYHDFTDLFIKNNTLYDNLYLVRPNKDFFFLNEGKKKNDAKFLEIERFVSNKSHTAFLSIYKHFPYIPFPEVDISQHYKYAKLKAYIPEYNTYIYQVQNKIVWLIGAEIDSKTEIIYHIHTDSPELLPESRIKHKFDNWGFYFNDKSGKERIGKYHVFEKAIPSQYPISQINVGFNNGISIIWRSFTLSF